ncbi:hypothetical protein GCM10010218_50280 [Streptomyces mashuensis]|uniref:Uncharacterized protein n=1 Tax=Streptomyces mashuensis TaxID=33904 RepID=A0A919B883_9ACTN|nr:hypothetical protein GCM10010218_50280 [Streptomyces mashuensis]
MASRGAGRPDKGCGGTRELRYRRWHVHRVTKRARFFAHQAGYFARHLVRLARNRRVGVAWVPGIRACGPWGLGA